MICAESHSGHTSISLIGATSEQLIEPRGWVLGDQMLDSASAMSASWYSSPSSTSTVVVPPKTAPSPTAAARCSTQPIRRRMM
ncbi:MAG: hypothetical protein RI544_06010 [Haloquadratum sp.]|nr:hypothetical protein [Haloquadratum sp.]